jgi:hypothetical protein
MKRDEEKLLSIIQDFYEENQHLRKINKLLTKILSELQKENRI